MKIADSMNSIKQFKKELLLIIPFILLFTFTVYDSMDYLFIDKKVIESMENKNNQNNKDECEKLDIRYLKSLQENTKNIELLREQFNKINIDKLKSDITNVKILIENNKNSLKDITDQGRQRSNQDLNMDVKRDGNVYDEDGNPLYEEK